MLTSSPLWGASHISARSVIRASVRDAVRAAVPPPLQSPTPSPITCPSTTGVAFSTAVPAVASSWAGSRNVVESCVAVAGVSRVWRRPGSLLRLRTMAASALLAASWASRFWLVACKGGCARYFRNSFSILARRLRRFRISSHLSFPFSRCLSLSLSVSLPRSLQKCTCKYVAISWW